MKLSDLSVVKDLPILFPDGESTGIVFQVRAAHSQAVKDATIAARRAFKTAQTEGDEIDKQLAEEQALLQILAAVVVGWSNLEDELGEPIPFSQEAALRIFSKPEFAFIVEQVARYAVERQNFFRRSIPTTK
jgi:hypothetical protein